MKTLIFLLLFIPSCWNDPPDEPSTYCWECKYHSDTWLFCDMTHHQIDSLKDVFGYDCPHDSLVCEIDTIFNLIIKP